eukprot:357924-Chlamydomonas_euryale.AAC.7
MLVSGRGESDELVTPIMACLSRRPRQSTCLRLSDCYDAQAMAAGGIGLPEHLRQRDGGTRAQRSRPCAWRKICSTRTLKLRAHPPKSLLFAPYSLPNPLFSHPRATSLNHLDSHPQATSPPS